MKITMQDVTISKFVMPPRLEGGIPVTLVTATLTTSVDKAFTETQQDFARLHALQGISEEEFLVSVKRDLVRELQYKFYGEVAEQWAEHRDSLLEVTANSSLMQVTQVVDDFTTYLNSLFDINAPASARNP